jgi:hypothetical protein
VENTKVICHRISQGLGGYPEGGELGRTEAWLGDKLKVEGDMVLLTQLEDLISEAWGEKWQPLDIQGKS